MSRMMEKFCEKRSNNFLTFGFAIDQSRPWARSRMRGCGRVVGEQRESVEVGGAVEAFTTSHCSRPAQPTPLSALLDRPGLQLLYCLIRAGRLRWEKGGLWGRLHEHPPRSTITHWLEPPNQRACPLLKLFLHTRLICH